MIVELDMLKTFKKIPYKFDILILIAILSLSVIEWFHIQISTYYAGLNNTYTIGPFYACYYEPAKIVLVVLALIRIVYYFRPDKKFGKNILILFFSISIFIASWILPFFIFPPGAVYFLKGFEKWVHKNVDIDAVQTWILTEEANKYLDQRYDKGNFPDDFPEFIKNVEPLFIGFSGNDSEKGKCIEFWWGNTFSDWGIVIGSPEMKIQQSGVIKHSKSYYEFRRSIRPGIYIFEAG